MLWSSLALTLSVLVSRPATGGEETGEAGREAARRGPETEAEAARGREAGDEDWRIRGGWLSIAPIGFALPSPGGDVATLRQAVAGGYRWGFSAGFSLEPRPHLLVNVTGNFDQTIWVFRNFAGYELCFAGDCYGWTERGLGQLMRLGASLRLGYVDRHLLAWAQLGAHVGVSRIHLDCDHSREAHCDRRETDVGPGVSGGLGIAARLTPRFALGLEGGVDHSWLDRRDDPFAAARCLSLAMIAALRF
ncbi:hypothetical protein G6O69_02015 [Pseudenhygromyxa sp. WMMC2535]|uniref:hypothetical protein n=1 Tax=Pseudenhygromyxa sp. WMMC2535 TaxID=2712867 RepID=UPI0015581F22|nr:hypothetical protein [Pseudenhygromyxa sp. WMMC2535]NVB36590.1 hypothetical protein [Pseudenhygromyxa sp. WMMC2535]